MDLGLLAGIMIVDVSVVAALIALAVASTCSAGLAHGEMTLAPGSHRRLCTTAHLINRVYT